MLNPFMKKIYAESLLENNNDQIICINELKYNLMAKNCICPGIITIISFLITMGKPVYENSKYKVEEAKWSLYIYIYII